MKFGTLIRAHRLRQNLSMDKICQQVDLSKAYLSLIETGQKTPPKDDVVVQIARALGLDEHDLLMRAHRERFPDDVLELRHIIRDLRQTLDRLNEVVDETQASASGAEEEDLDLTGDFLIEMSASPGTVGSDVSVVRCAKVLRSTLHDLERLLPPDLEGAGELAAELEDLRAEERDFLLHVIQGMKQLRPRRGPQSVIDD